MGRTDSASGAASPLPAALAVGGTWALSRGILAALGLRFDARTDWFFFHDPTLLRDALGESLLHTHAFPPGMSLYGGLVLRLAGEGAPWVFQAVSHGAALTTLVSMAALLVAFGMGRVAVVAWVTLFGLTPAFLFFETVLHPTLPSAALAAAAAVLLHRALVDGRWPWWTLLFLDGAALGFLNATFHLVWLAALLGLAVAVRPRWWRRIVASAAGPGLLLGALYAKNVVLFGFFGAHSWLGFHLAKGTVRQLPAAERAAWIADGTLHPVSGPPIYAPADAYGDVGSETGVAVLDRLRRADGFPNLNHRALVEVSRLRLRDDLRTIRLRPAAWLATVGASAADFAGPTSRWHPRDPDGSPHRAAREILEPWEDLWNGAIHSVPVPGPGLYLLLLPGVAWLGLSALRRMRDDPGDALAPTVVFMVGTALYVPGLSCLIEVGELERYRFVVEPFLWTVPLGVLGGAAWKASRAGAAPPAATG